MQKKTMAIITIVSLLGLAGLLTGCIPGEEVAGIDPLQKMANATTKSMDKSTAAINDVSVPKPANYIEAGAIPPEVVTAATGFADNGKNPNISKSTLMPYAEFSKYHFGDFIGGQPDTDITAAALLAEFAKVSPNDMIYPVVSEYTIAGDATPRKVLVIVIGTNFYPANPIEWNK